MKRKIYDQLLSWKADRNGTCLTVKGQRQIGKTYIIEKFASDNYRHVVKIDFSVNPEFKSIFENGYDLGSLVSAIELKFGLDPIVPEDTLFFFDEIQDCPDAHASLKQFAIDGRYHVIASGSLLGVTNVMSHRKKDERPLSPMGYERVLVMHPMDFEEYLWAVGFPIDKLDSVKKHISDRMELTSTELEVVSGHFRDYMIVGGMPAAVRDFVKNGSYAEAGIQQDNILSNVINDINRYNDPVNALKTQKCFESIPEQLSSGNKKYHYSRVENGTGSRGSAQKYFENLMWIEEAGYGNFCYALESPELPFRRIPDSFKVYFSDTGLLIRMMGRSAAIAVYDGRSEYNRGALTENVVAECLMKCGIKPHYYRKSSGTSQLEIDFVVDLLGESAVIEVKSGKSRESPSIEKAGRLFHVDRRIKLENGNIRMDEDGIEHYPLFVAAFIRLLEREWDGPEF